MRLGKKKEYSAVVKNKSENENKNENENESQNESETESGNEKENENANANANTNANGNANENANENEIENENENENESGNGLNWTSSVCFFRDQSWLVQKASSPWATSAGCQLMKAPKWRHPFWM